MQIRTKSGIGLIALGIVVSVAWNVWTRTRQPMPLEQRVFLQAGRSVSAEFRPNFDGWYLIEITAEKTPNRPQVGCLMGVAPDTRPCAGHPPVLEVDWVLDRDGRELKRGSSREAHSQPIATEEWTRVIGEFPGEAGRRYTLRITPARDGASLAAARPRLRAVIASLAQTDFQSASVLVFSISFICVMFGAILLGIAAVKRPGA